MSIWSIISAIAETLAALVAAIAIYMAVKLQKRQMLLERRQLLFPLWGYLQELNEIDPKNPVWHDVIKAVNTLELIAISWEAQLIDENIIRRMYSDLFIEFYRKIQDCKNPPPGIKDGNQLLLACPAVINLYQQFMSEITEGNRVPPLK